MNRRSDRAKDYYSILGVSPTAELVVIRAAYRALALRYHPDTWGGDKTYAENLMRELNEAYEVLSNATFALAVDGADVLLERLRGLIGNLVARIPKKLAPNHKT